MDDHGGSIRFFKLQHYGTFRKFGEGSVAFAVGCSSSIENQSIANSCRHMGKQAIEDARRSEWVSSAL
jgi:hypothetical protein